MREPLRLVVILGALSAFGPLSVDFYLPGLPRLTRDFGVGASAGQLTLTACVLGLAVGQLAAGPLSDRFGRRPPLLAGLAAYCAASVACAVAPSVWALVAFRAIQGLGGAAGIVVSRSVVRDLRSGVSAARLFSILMLVVGVVPVLAPVAGGQLLRVTSWRGLFLILAAVDAAILVATALWLHETPPPERRQRAGQTAAGFLQLLRDRLFLAYALVLGLSFAEMFSYIAGSSFALQDIYGLSPQLYGGVFGLNALGIVACSQLNRALLGRLGPERLLARRRHGRRDRRRDAARGRAHGRDRPARDPAVPVRRRRLDRARDPERGRTRAHRLPARGGKRLGAAGRVPVRLRRGCRAARRRRGQGDGGADGAPDRALRRGSARRGRRRQKPGSRSHCGGRRRDDPPSPAYAGFGSGSIARSARSISCSSSATSVSFPAR